MRIILQFLGILVLIPLVAISTLAYKNQEADGPTILFPGGRLVSGSLHTGPEPDWSFADNIQTIELQLSDPISSRFVWVLPVNGKIYVASGYMNSILGRIWKHWAVQADEGNREAVIRINGTRYEREIIRIKQGLELDGVARVMTNKYGSPTTRQQIEAGNTWVFELTPRGRP